MNNPTQPTIAEPIPAELIAITRKLLSWAELYAKSNYIDTRNPSGPLSRDCFDARELLAKLTPAREN